MVAHLRFLRGLSLGSVPFLYIEWKKEGWYLLRQIRQKFLPHVSSRQLRLSLWIAHHMKEPLLARSVLSEIVSLRLFDSDTLDLLRNCGVPISSHGAPWMVDMASAEKILQFYNPTLAIQDVMLFLQINHELLKKGGRKRAVSMKDRIRIAASQGWTCAQCPVVFDCDLRFEIDHKIAWSKGGTNRRLNLQALCPACHAKKTAKSREGPFEKVLWGFL